jgi:hypothetical protein
MSLNRLIKDGLSGSIAKSYVAEITRFHRIQGSTMYHEAAEYVKNELQKLGFKDALIEQYPADGKTKYWTHNSPIGWTIRSAEVRMTEPEEALLCTYEDCPQSLHTYSNATPEEGITAELIDVGAGTRSKDYEGKNVKGKFVLATGRAKLVHEQAVYKYGAAGVITDTITYEMPCVRESLDVPDAHAYQAIWPTAKQLPKAKFGFSLSKRQGNHLRAIFNSGKTVKLKAKVDASLFKGNEEVITATIKGKQMPDEEIFLIAHLCHPKPSANDNASGSGLLLEIARTIKTLIASGRIHQPVRTIRFMWVPETLGTVAYISTHKDVSKRMVAGINLDMVGQNQELCKSTLNLDRTPDSCPSYLNDFIFNLIEQTVNEFDYPTHFGSGSTFRYRSTPFSGGSDHAEFTEATTNVPCVMLLQWPDLYYHTSMDTIDKVSEASLKRVGWVTAVAALTLANASVETAYQLAQETASRGTVRIAEASYQATQMLFRKKDDVKLTVKTKELAQELVRAANYQKNRIEHFIWREQRAIKSVKRLAESKELTAQINKSCADIARMGKLEIQKLQETLSYIAKISNLKLPAKVEETKAEKQLVKLVPKRLFRGTLSNDLLKERLGEKEYEWYQEIDEKDPDFSKKMLEVVNFADGKRDAQSIVKAISAEYAPIEPEYVIKFLNDLKKAKFIVFK